MTNCWVYRYVESGGDGLRFIKGEKRPDVDDCWKFLGAFDLPDDFLNTLLNEIEDFDFSNFMSIHGQG